MEVCVMAFTNETGEMESGGIQSYVRHILGDDDLMPSELLDEEDLSLLSPADFHQAITA